MYVNLLVVARPAGAASTPPRHGPGAAGALGLISFRQEDIVPAASPRRVPAASPYRAPSRYA